MRRPLTFLVKRVRKSENYTLAESPPPGVRVDSPSSHVQRATGVRPFARLRHRPAEGRDELQQAVPQLGFRPEVAPLQNPTRSHAEPDLHLIQPRRVFRQIYEPNPMTRVRQKRLPRRHRLQHAAVPLLPPATPSSAGRTSPRSTAPASPNNASSGCPRRRSNRSTGPPDVGREVRFIPRRLHRRSDHATRRHLEVRRQTLTIQTGRLIGEIPTHNRGRSLPEFAGVDASRIREALAHIRPDSCHTGKWDFADRIRVASADRTRSAQNCIVRSDSTGALGQVVANAQRRIRGVETRRVDRTG